MEKLIVKIFESGMVVDEVGVGMELLGGDEFGVEETGDDDCCAKEGLLDSPLSSLSGHVTVRQVKEPGQSQYLATSLNIVSPKHCISWTTKPSPHDT